MDEATFNRVSQDWLTGDAGTREFLEKEYPWIKSLVGSNWGMKRERAMIAAMLDEIDTMIVDQQPHHRIHEKFAEAQRFILKTLSGLGD